MNGYSAVGFFLPIGIPLHFGIAAFLVHILSFHLATLTLIKLNMELEAPSISLGKNIQSQYICKRLCEAISSIDLYLCVIIAQESQRSL